MGGVASVQGKVSAGDANAPDFSIALNIATGVVTKQFRGRRTVTAGATIEISKEGTANIKFIWLKGTDPTTGDPKYFTPQFNTTVTLPNTTEMIYCSYNGTSNVTKMEIIAQAGTDTVIEFAFAGD